MGPTVIRSVAMAFALVLTSTYAFAQQQSDVESLRAEVARLREALAAVEAKLAELPGAPPAAATTPAQPEVAVQSAAPSGASKAFNPDTSVLGNFVGVAGKN